MSDIIFVLLHFFIFLFTYIILEKKLFQPAVLFSFIWFVVISLRLVCKVTILDELAPISLETYGIFVIGTVCFSVSSIIVALSLKKIDFGTNTAKATNAVISPGLRGVLLAIILLGLPLYINAAYKIFIASQIESFFMSLRYELSYGDADIGPLKYLMPLSYVIFAQNLYVYNNNKTRFNLAILIVTLLVTTIYAVLATGRTFFFMILVIYLGISYLTNLKFSMKKYAASLGAFFGIFIFFGIVLGKGGNTNDNVKENIRSSAEFLGIYIVSSINALDVELKQHTEATLGGDNSFRFFLKAAMELNLIPRRKLNEPKQEFVFVPYPTNTYTYYNFYILDFGRLYAWVMLAFYGALHTWLFHQAVYKKSKRCMLYYTFLLFPLMLSFFSDLYLSLFSFWIQLAFFTELLFFINHLVLNRKLFGKQFYPGIGN